MMGGLKVRNPVKYEEQFAPALGLLPLSLIAILLGVVTGLGAVAFRGMIAGVHNFFFLGSFTIDYDANMFTPASPWGVGIILVP